MMNSYFPARLGAACAMLVPGLALAQAPTITAVAPGRNSTSASPAVASVTFSQPVTGAAGIRVFGSRWRGLMTGTTAGDGTTQLSFQAPLGMGFGLDELVSVMVPATVRGAGTGGVATAGAVYQFRTRMMGQSTGIFVGTGSLPEVGTALFDPTLADVNNDGRLDLLLADEQNDRVRLRLGAATTSFGAATLLNTGGQPGSIAVADMNNDGNLDLLTSSNGATVRAVTVAMGTGLGTFGTASPVLVAAPPGQVRVGDVNADGNLDFVVTVVAPLATPAGPASAVLAVRLGNGQGGFTAMPDVPLDLNAANLHLADFDNDGRLDCLVGSLASATLKLYLGNGQGGFVLAATPALPRTGATDVADLNGDGVLDVLMADNAGNAVRVYPGTGTGAFGTPMVLAVTGPQAVHAADVDSDGYPDVLATYNGGSAATAGTVLWHNTFNTPGTFSRAYPMTNCAGTALVAGMLGGWPGLVVVDNGLNGASPNIKARFNQPVLATRPGAAVLPAALYPNPAHGTAQVAFPQGTATAVQAEVTDALGRRVQQQALPRLLAGASATLDVSRLAPGLYTLHLTANNQTATHKLVVE